MCGIAGIVKWGDKPIDEVTLGILLVGNEHRGNDASGLCIQQADGKLNVIKADKPGWQLIATKEYKEFIKEHLRPDSKATIVHARGASQGTPRSNVNNHPMYAGVSAVIHNGVIRNDDHLFRTLGLERKAETDSDVLRAIVDKFGITREGIKHLAMASGSGAIAGFHPGYPGKLLLARSGNPLTLASNDDFFYFSSEKDTLHKACRLFVERKGMWFHEQRPNVAFADMPQNTAWIIGLKGLEEHYECRICVGEYKEPWRRTYKCYRERQTKWDNMARTSSTKPASVDGATKSAWCYHCKMIWMIPKEAEYGEYTCNPKFNGCGGILWKPPMTPLMNSEDEGKGRVN